MDYIFELSIHFDEEIVIEFASSQLAARNFWDKECCLVLSPSIKIMGGDNAAM